MKYHFKSIDTWLMGICKSFCPEHLWRSSVYDPGNKSIFAEDKEDQCQAAEEEEGSSQEQQQTVSLLSHKEQNHPSPCLRISKDEQIPKDQIETTTIIGEELKNIKIEYQCLDDEENAKKEEASDNNLCDFDHEQLDKEFVDYDRTNCFCPECCPIYLNCIHNQDKNQESGICNLEEMSSNELTSSLECFEVIASPECRREVEQTIATCPIEKAEPNGNSGSSSPSKDDSPSEGGFAQLIYCFLLCANYLFTCKVTRSSFSTTNLSAQQNDAKKMLFLIKCFILKVQTDHLRVTVMERRKGKTAHQNQ